MRHRRRARSLTTATLTALALAAGTLTASTAVAAPAPTGDAFYTAPADLSGAPGTVIRSEPSALAVAPLVPAPATAQRILYVSTDRTGARIAVSGTVITPTAPWRGPGQRPVVGYGVGTQGLGDQCAPSKLLPAGTEYEGAAITALVAQGYGVVVTDYQGLGTPGDHTYVSREVTGRAVLDSVRAAQQLRGAGLPAHGPIALVGYSQGGGATAAAAEIAPTYAPDLDLRGVVAGAVPADLGRVATSLDGGPYAGLLLDAVAGLATSYGIDTGAYLNARGQQAVADLRQGCTEAAFRYAFTRVSDLTEDGSSAVELLAREPFRSIVAEQTIGARTPTAPVLLTHSRLDDIIPYDVGRTLATTWCGRGANVRFSPNLVPTHLGGYPVSQVETTTFLAARFAGTPAVTGCGSPVLR